jgi:hypothetical protein
MASCVVSCTVGDVVEDEDATDTSDLIDTAPHERPFALFPGVNSGYCTASKFNCRFHQSGSRVTDASGNEGWAIQPGGTVIDGNGTALATETSTHMTFNYGQVRTIGGVAYALALTTSNGSAGWYPIDHIVDTTFRSRAGEVAAKDPQQGEMGCYEVVHVSDDTLAAKKVVHDSTEPPTGHERAGDYLPLVRADGKRSVNLLFSVPGFGLGGATTDHFRAGVKFQRVDVPTETNRPSISIPLWVQDAEGRYRTQSGTMRFIYGYVRTANGSRRFGWMARPALQVSTGCT